MLHPDTIRLRQEGRKVFMSGVIDLQERKELSQQQAESRRINIYKLVQVYAGNLLSNPNVKVDRVLELAVSTATQVTDWIYDDDKRANS